MIIKMGYDDERFSESALLYQLQICWDEWADPTLSEEERRKIKNYTRELEELLGYKKK